MSTPHWRPRVHFTPTRHWINDPNGLVWHAGEWHLFYQFNPHGDTWGHMSWGHAVSPDLLHWHELPVAIPEDDDWMIFSGSVVVPPGGPMTACYTGHAQREPQRQVQQLAFSHDRGRTWAKHGAPVLDIGLAHFRDPKVFWHAPTARWVMLVSRAAEGRLAFYGSADLLAWQELSIFDCALPAGCRLWECPDLLAFDDAWLLKWDVFEGHPGGGSGALAVVGDFDGTRFTARQPPQWLDGGMDFYAAIAFGALPPGDGRRVWMGWMNDHHYATDTPTAPWRGAMTLPREVSLVATPQGLAVAQQPVRELLALRGAPLAHGGRDIGPEGIELAAPGALPVAHDIVLRVAAPQAPRWHLHLRAGGAEATVLTIDREAGELRLDRSASGACPPAGGFAGTRRLAWPGARDAVADLRIVVDACSVEVFAGDGRAVVTELVFPQPAHTGIRLQPEGPVRLLAFTAWPLADARPAPAPAP